jgi:predicted secreted protein
MHRFVRIATIGFACALALSACSSDAKATPTTVDLAPVSAKLIFTYPGVPIKVTAGQRFAIRLDAQPASGQVWYLAKSLNSSIIVPDGDRFNAKNVKVLGGPGTEDLFFAALHPGPQSIQLAYGRASDKSATPYDTTTFHVTVTQ